MTLRIGLDNDGTYMTIIMVTSRAQASYSNIYIHVETKKNVGLHADLMKSTSESADRLDSLDSLDSNSCGQTVSCRMSSKMQDAHEDLKDTHFISLLTYHGTTSKYANHTPLAT